ncbi:hypothetical protein ABZ863_09170 [Saccharomonospora sp. NPDC046836]|uniref:hypothetical protein n=1 Tax=Saccharomonospora sp. NPDC046836 TaxID=3156921 RepID=UPI0033C855BB
MLENRANTPHVRPPTFGTIADSIARLIEAANNAPGIDLGILLPSDSAGDQPYQPEDAQNNAGQSGQLPPATGQLDGACATGGDRRADGSPTAQIWQCGSVTQKNEIDYSIRHEYIAALEGLKDKGALMLAFGLSEEFVARKLHAERRSIGVKYKDLTPQYMLDKIYPRNIEKYGDPLGPSVDYLRERGKSWLDIIESASRSGGRDLGLGKDQI